MSIILILLTGFQLPTKRSVLINVEVPIGILYANNGNDIRIKIESVLFLHDIETIGEPFFSSAKFTNINNTVFLSTKNNKHLSGQIEWSENNFFAVIKS